MANALCQCDERPIGKVTYVQQVDLHGDMPNNGYSTLLFNHDCSIYIQNGAPLGDSSFSSPEYILPVTVAGDKEGFPVYKLHSERKIYCKIDCRQAFEHCILEDTLGAIKWELKPDLKQIGGYECKKAVGLFRGRIYEAWYALDIPIPSGPFKLGGLPGLILDAHSQDEKVRFTFAQLEISPKIQGKIVVPTGKYLNMTYAKFLQKEAEFYDNLVKEYKAKGIEITTYRDDFIEANGNE